jgi:hypothetical protein
MVWGWVEEKVLTPDPCMTLDKLLPKLPAIMRHKCWINGAILMEKWFRQARNTIPEHGAHDVTTIKMDWVLSYARARVVYDEAVKERVWVNPAAQEEIKDLIKNTNTLPPRLLGSKQVFGGVRAASEPRVMQKFHDSQIQYREFKQSTAALDDLYAALGDFSFYFVVEGIIECISTKPRYRVTIDKVGVYVMDSYDFNDDSPTRPSQPLGMWNCKRHDAQKWPELDYHYVDNASFREWRNKYGRGMGGDYLVFSDIKVIKTNDRFEFE